MTPLQAAETLLSPLVGARLASRYLAVADALVHGARPTCYTQRINDAAGATYMRRFYVCGKLESPQVWLHEIAGSDPDPDLHDHPWDYSTVLLQGAYVEETTSGRATYREGETLKRKAEALHRLHLTSPALTLFVVPRQRRRWGFATPRGWVDASVYMRSRAKRNPKATK